MRQDTLMRLRKEFQEFPIIVANSFPTVNEIEQASIELGIPFPNDYVQFLQEFGGATVGPYPIFGLRPVSVMGDEEWSVVKMTKFYRAQPVPGTDKWVVFSEDHAGNPIGFDAKGVVWIHDHDFGGIAQLAESFEDYLRKRCLKLNE